MTAPVLLATVLLFFVSATTGRAEEVQLPIAHLRLTIERPGAPGGFFGLLSRAFGFLQARILTPMPGTKLRVVATAYSSTIGQTDLSPCITALGTRVQPGTLATNIFPFGTILRIGDKRYVVTDRMHERYNSVLVIDLWHIRRQEALAFGKRSLEIEVLGYIPRPQLSNEVIRHIWSSDQLPANVQARPSSRRSSEAPTGSALGRLAQSFQQWIGARLSIPEEEECFRS